MYFPRLDPHSAPILPSITSVVLREVLEEDTQHSTLLAPRCQGTTIGWWKEAEPGL